jgi:septal ring factor EnvC (AmiA/AmiB activator)
MANMNTTDLVAHLKSLAWLWRHLVSYGGLFVGAWIFLGPFIEVQAQDVLKKLLIENPAFIEMQQQLEANGKQQKELEKDLNAVQSTISKIDGNITAQKNTIDDVKMLVQELVRAQINRRTSIDDMPPWTGPVQP